ncbi:hypothetical protein J2W92_002299 [Rhizobium leguminosarum]
MNRGPISGTAGIDHLAKCFQAWGNPPDWIIVLAEACSRNSQKTVGEQIKYSAATVSQVLSNSYRGDLAAVETMIRGALMAEIVTCPIVGEMARNMCLGWQKKPFNATSSHRVRMYQACRSGCPHSRISASQPSGDSE